MTESPTQFRKNWPDFLQPIHTEEKRNKRYQALIDSIVQTSFEFLQIKMKTVVK